MAASGDGEKEVASEKPVMIVTSNPFFLEKVKRLQQRSDIAQFAQQLREHNQNKDGIAEWLEQKAYGNHSEITDISRTINDNKTHEEKINALSGIMQQRNNDYIKSRNQIIMAGIGMAVTATVVVPIMIFAGITGFIAYYDIDTSDLGGHEAD